MRMENMTSLRHFHRVILTIGSLTLSIYAIAIVSAMFFFRGEVRHQILQRDGTLLTSVTQHFFQKEGLPENGLALLDVALESSEISGVIAVRLFFPDGSLIGKVPQTLHEASLSQSDLNTLKGGNPVTRHINDLSLDFLFSDENILAPLGTDPVTMVLAPVHNLEGSTVAIIQYWLDGNEIALELRQLDRFLALLGSAFFLSGGLIFLLVFGYARNRLLSMGLILAERNRSLEQANADLALAARTSAIGSVTSHLFHGLKNPLAGLKTYLKLTGRDEEAVAIADRMQSLIDEALSVIRDEDKGTDMELTAEEFAEIVEARLAGFADQTVALECSGEGIISSRKTQLLLLILRNLVDNAAEASPKGETVSVRVSVGPDALIIAVEDSGPGLSDDIKGNLFEPVQSSKVNGSGIGLAISSVIARHIPATLTLEKSSPEGTTFLINMPL